MVALALTLQPSKRSASEGDGGLELIERPGILQIVWLIGNQDDERWQEDLPEQLYDAVGEKPTKTELRKAGLKLLLHKDEVKRCTTDPDVKLDAVTYSSVPELGYKEESAQSEWV